jgi:hypothetical protein
VAPPRFDSGEVMTEDTRDRIWPEKSGIACDPTITAAGAAQHVFAAEYKVNPGRVAEVLAGKRFPNARAVALGEPPKPAKPEPNRLK